jgi:hypothetical protein
MIGHEHVWLGTDNGGDPTPEDPRDALYRYRLDDLLKGQRITYSGEKDEGKLPLTHFLGDEGPLSDYHFIALAAEFPRRLFVGYLPTGPERLRVFMLTNVRGRVKLVGDDGMITGQILDVTGDETKKPRWSLTAYDFRGQWDAEERAWGNGKWSDRESIAVAFKEPFQVAARGDDYYFVTASGEVYRSPKPDKGKDRKTEALWTDAKRPVVAFIQDTDAGKSFAFCKPDKDGKGVYFELAPKLESVVYDAKGLKPAKPDDPLPAVLGYAKILLADKKIKGK